MASMPNDQASAAGRQGGAYNVVTHFILLPTFVINLIVAIVVAVQASRAGQHPLLHWWLVIVSLALLLSAGQMRVYSLAVQDRVIRLEERIRIAALVPGADLSRLSLRQYIALRFASDAELPDLVHRAINEQLDEKAIKAAVTSWGSDEIRV